MTTSENAKVALVTVPTKASGRPSCRGLARDGFIVYLGARSPERGKDSGGGVGKRMELFILCN